MSTFVNQVSWTWLAQVLALVVSLATTAIVARWLGAEGRGEVALVLLIPGMLQVFVGLGMSSASVYFTASGRVAIGEVVANGMTVALLGTLGGGAIVVGLIAGALLPVFAPGVPAGYVLLGMLALPLGLLGSSLAAGLQGLGQIRTLNVLSMLQAGASMPLLLLFVVWLEMGVAGAVLTSLTVGVLMLALTARCVGGQGVSVLPRWNVGIMREMLGFGLKGYVGNVLQLFNYRVDLLFVNVFVGLAGVGMYAASVALAEVVWQVANGVGFVMFPKAASTDPETMNALTPRVFWSVLIISSGGAILLWVFGRLVISTVWSSAFVDAYEPMLALLPGVVLLGGAKVLASDIAGRGYPDYNSVVAGCALGVTVGLDLWLIPKMGIFGAALASTVAYSVTCVLSVVLYVVVSRRAGRSGPGRGQVAYGASET